MLDWKTWSHGKQSLKYRFFTHLMTWLVKLEASQPKSGKILVKLVEQIVGLEK